MATPMEVSASAPLPGNLHASWTREAFNNWQRLSNAAVTPLAANFARLAVYLLVGFESIFSAATEPFLPGLPMGQTERATLWATLTAAILSGVEMRVTLSGDASAIRPAPQESLVAASGALSSLPAELQLLSAFFEGGAALVWNLLPRQLSVMLYTWLCYIVQAVSGDEAAAAVNTALLALLPDHFDKLSSASKTLVDTAVPPYDFSWDHAPLYLRVVDHLSASLAELVRPLESGRLQFHNTLSWHGLAAVRLAKAGLPTGTTPAMPLHLPRPNIRNLTTPSYGWESLPERHGREAAAAAAPTTRPRGNSRPHSSGPGPRSAKRAKTSAGRLREEDYPDQLRMLSLYQLILGRDGPSTTQELHSLWSNSKDHCALCKGLKHKLLECPTVAALPDAKRDRVGEVLKERAAFQINK